MLAKTSHIGPSISTVRFEDVSKLPILVGHHGNALIGFMLNKVHHSTNYVISHYF